MLKKLFQSKRRKQSNKQKDNPKVAMDPASLAILNRHFSPLSFQVKSPSSVLDIVGYPRLTVRNVVTPDQEPAQEQKHEKTLLEEQDTLDEVSQLHQRLEEFERERDLWHRKLQEYMLREEQLRRIIQDNQIQINQLRKRVSSHSWSDEIYNSRMYNNSDGSDSNDDDPNEEDLYYCYYPLRRRHSYYSPYPYAYYYYQ